MRIAVLLLLLCGLCSCSFDQRPAQIRCEPITHFSCRTDCTQADETFAFATECENGEIRISVLQPEDLQGVCFISDSQNSIAVDANGLTDVFALASFTEHSPIRLLMQGIRAFLYTGTETLTACADGTFSAQKQVDGQIASAVFSENGQLLRLHFPNSETEFTFVDFQSCKNDNDVL